jgi:hypothetical protein
MPRRLCSRTHQGKQSGDTQTAGRHGQDHSGVKDVGLVQRSHIIAFRDKLYDSGQYATASANKRTGYITTLVKTAANKGWIEQAIRGDIRLTVPKGEDAREPYSADDLDTIFGHPSVVRRP